MIGAFIEANIKLTPNEQGIVVAIIATAIFLTILYIWLWRESKKNE
jgi:hypothetical protein